MRKLFPLGLACAVLAVSWALVPASVHATTIIQVTTSADSTSNNGLCSLREAIVAANTDTASGGAAGECPAGIGGDIIVVPAMTITLSGRLEVSSNILLIGSGVDSTIIDGGGLDMVFMLESGNIGLRQITIQDGNSGTVGGGFWASNGTHVEIADARISDNRAFTGGGGIYIEEGANVSMTRTRMDGNMANGAFGGAVMNLGTLFIEESLIGGTPVGPGNPVGPGTGNDSNRAGGIYNSADGILNLRNVTVTGNHAHSPSAGAGGVMNVGFAFLNNVTVTENLGFGDNPGSFTGGGVQSASGATTVVKNSIIANNDGRGGPNDCAGELTSDSRYNLLEDTDGCDLPAVTDTWVLGEDPQLSSLSDHGGPTHTQIPLPSSPVVDAGYPFPAGGPAADSCEAVDQRGTARQLICDMGAVERAGTVPTVLHVTTTSDVVDDVPGDGACEPCSLRGAVQEANRLPGHQTIIVPAGTYNLSIPPANEGGFDPAAGGDLDLRDGVTVMGAEGATRETVIVDGNDISRIFDIATAEVVTIQRMTIRDGTDSGGGGVRLQATTLIMDDVIVEDNESTFTGGGIQIGGLDSTFVLTNSIVRENSAPFFGGDGGGIDADGDITIEDSHVVDNDASGAGGGIRATGEVNITRSTISGNVTEGSIFSNGGGISALGLHLVESTVSGNSSQEQGGGVFGSGEIVNSTISGNTSGTNGGGVSTSGTIALVHVTIADNVAEEGGNGLHRFGTTSGMTIQNTILANAPGTECATLLPTSEGNNIVSDDSCEIAGDGDQVDADANLGPLADNGGPTMTHVPLAGSPAIDGGAEAGVTNDQRDEARPQGPAPDVGAVETPGLIVAVWWPKDGTVVSGSHQPVKAVLVGVPLANYNMFWRVDGGPLVGMFNIFSGAEPPHKKAYINYTGWAWSPDGTYTLTFVAEDLGGAPLAQSSVEIVVP